MSKLNRKEFLEYNIASLNKQIANMNIILADWTKVGHIDGIPFTVDMAESIKANTKAAQQVATNYELELKELIK